MSSNPIEMSSAVNFILETARREFAEPYGHPANYRFSINGDQLEIMHATRRPIEWRVIPIKVGG